MNTGLFMTYESAVIPLERPQLDPIANPTYTVFDPRESNRPLRETPLDQGDCPVIMSATNSLDLTDSMSMNQLVCYEIMNSSALLFSIFCIKSSAILVYTL
jgi:hypothetical protein